MTLKHLIIPAAVLLLAGCNDDDCAECPPADVPPTPTLANIWPHADGTQWVYDLQFNQHAGPAASDTAPPMPTLAELHAALQQPIPTELLESSEGLYRLRFEGQVTTESGVVAQRLVGRIYTELSGAPRVVDGQRRLLLAIARARRDCRDAILARLGATIDDLKSLEDTDGPYFLGMYTFAYEDSGYYGYGDLNTQHSWIYLEGDIAVGREFSLQLVPELADDIWLYGRIWSIGDRGVEYMYAIDLGVQEAVNEQGEPLGSFRSYFYGSTLFVPGVGPVACDERRVLAPDWVLQDPLPSCQEYRCRLAGPAS